MPDAVLPRRSSAGVCLDGSAATAVVVTGGAVEDVHVAAQATAAGALAAVLRLVRVSDPGALVSVGAPTAALEVAMSPDMLAPDRFAQVAFERLSSAAAAGAVALPDPSVLTGVLGRPEVVRAGRLSTALAVAAAAPPTGQLSRWVSGTGAGRTVSWLVAPSVAGAAPPGLTVWLFSSALIVSARLGAQPLGWRQVRTFGWSAAADRIGPDGVDRLRAAWAGGRGDPVGQFEARRVAQAAVEEVVRLRAALSAAGFGLPVQVPVLCAWGASPLLAEAAQAASVVFVAGLAGDEKVSPALVAARGAAEAQDLFGGSVVMERVRT